MTYISATEAKAKFSKLLTAVENGKTVSITRHGKVIACIVPGEIAHQERIDRAIDGIRELRKRTKPVSVEEILAWRDEGRK